MLREPRMVMITVARNGVQLRMEPINLGVDLLFQSLYFYQVFSYQIYLLPVLVKKGLCVSQNLIHFVVHLAYLCYVLVIILLDDFYNVFLFFVQSISHSINVFIWLLNQLFIEFYINSLKSFQFSLHIFDLLCEEIILHLLRT